MRTEDISNKLMDKGLKVTPQRIAILDAIIKLNNHPTVDNIVDFIRKNHPHVSVATVYKVLEVMVASELIKKVNTEIGIMRYDAIMEKHHHLYSTDSDRIEDYQNTELNEMIEKYFEKKAIPGFKIEDIKLQIFGKFTQKR